MYIKIINIELCVKIIVEIKYLDMNVGLELCKEVLLKPMFKWVGEFFVENCKKIIFKNKSSVISDKTKGLILFENVVPSYSIEDIALRNSGKYFYWQIPDEYREEFCQYCRQDGRPFFETHIIQDGEDDSINRCLRAFVLNNYPEIRDIDSYFNEIAKETALRLLTRLKDGAFLFNNKMWGIDKIASNRGNGDSEDPTLDIRMFVTDFFTHKFMLNLYKDLNKKDPRVFDGIQTLSDLNKYKPFLCSISVGGFVLVERLKSETPELLWVKCGDYSDLDKYHFSYDVEFSPDDMSMLSVGGLDTSNLYTCACRGIEECLGIYGIEGTRERENVKIAAVALLKNDENLKFEFFSYLSIYDKVEELFSNVKQINKDENVCFVLLTKESINDFISDKKVVHSEESVFWAESLFIRYKVNRLS